MYGVEYAYGGHPGDSSGVFETRPFHNLIEQGVLPDTISLREQYNGGCSTRPHTHVHTNSHTHAHTHAHTHTRTPTHTHTHTHTPHTHL